MNKKMIFLVVSRCVLVVWGMSAMRNAQKNTKIVKKPNSYPDNH